MNKKSYNYYIISGVILLFIGVGILIYFLTRKKKGGGGGGATGATGATGGATGATGGATGATGATGGRVAYIKEDNNRTDQYSGCECPYSSSSGQLDEVVRLCDIDPNCKGYYTNGLYNEATWRIATDTDPASCDTGVTIAPLWNYYSRKDPFNSYTHDIPNPLNGVSPTGGYGCQLQKSNICDISTGCEEIVKSLCDIAPDCIGYYSNGVNGFVATDTEPSTCGSSDNTLGKYPYFYRKQP